MTSGSDTPTSDSEEASLPSENETVMLVEAMTATAWRREWGLEDEAVFAYAFQKVEDALEYGHAVANAWQRARDWVGLSGTTLVQNVIGTDARAREQRRAALKLAKRARKAAERRDSVRSGRDFGAKARAMLASGKATNKKPSVVEEKGQSDCKQVFSLFLTRLGVLEWNDVACGAHAHEMRAESLMRRTDDALDNGSMPTLLRAKHTVAELNEWWIQVYPDTPMTSLKEHHVEEFLHSDVSEGRASRAQHALKWIN